MSGLPTQKVSNDLIAKTYKKYGKKLDIIGVGGVFTAEDAYAKNSTRCKSRRASSLD